MGGTNYLLSGVILQVVPFPVIVANEGLVRNPRAQKKMLKNPTLVTSQQPGVRGTAQDGSIPPKNWSTVEGMCVYNVLLGTITYPP